MQSAENRANVDSEIKMRQMLEHALLELANRIKQISFWSAEKACTPSHITQYL